MGQEPENAPQEGQEPAPAPEEKPTGFDALPAETQAEIRKLRAEAASNRKAAQEAQAKVTEYEEANKSELEKLSSKLAQAEQAKVQTEAKLLRYQVAQEREVPAKLVPLLTGTTKDELEAQAALILDNTKPDKPDFDGGARQPAPKPKSAEEQHNADVLAMLGLSTD